MKKSSLIAISVIIVVIIISVFVLLFDFQFPFSLRTLTPSSITTPEPAAPELLRHEYPLYLIEGEITKIEKKDFKTEFTIETRIDKIFLTPPFDTKTIIVLADENTETFIYDMGKHEETSVDMAALQVNDQVLVGIAESNQNILTESFYTAIMIRKMIAPIL